MPRMSLSAYACMEGYPPAIRTRSSSQGNQENQRTIAGYCNELPPILDVTSFHDTSTGPCALARGTAELHLPGTHQDSAHPLSSSPPLHQSHFPSYLSLTFFGPFHCCSAHCRSLSLLNSSIRFRLEHYDVRTLFYGDHPITSRPCGASYTVNIWPQLSPPQRAVDLPMASLSAHRFFCTRSLPCFPYPLSYTVEY